MIFAAIACAVMLSGQCFYDPATYGQPRTIAGCHELVRLMAEETNGLRPAPTYQCVKLRGE